MVEILRIVEICFGIVYIVIKIIHNVKNNRPKK
jgi:hypothetical protein